MLVISGARDTQAALYVQVKGDFTGANNFFYWIAAILIIGALGYIPSLTKVSRVFLGLILLVIFLANGGIWDQLTSALSGTATASASPGGTGPSTPAGIAAAAGTGGASTGISGILSGLAGAFGFGGASTGNATTGTSATAPASSTASSGTGTAAGGSAPAAGSSGDITIFTGAGPQ